MSITPEVPGFTPEEVSDVCTEISLETGSVVAPANFNSPGQIVVSGPAASVPQLEEPFKEAGARLFVPLKVSGAFHSRYMRGPGEEFAEFVKDFEFSSPRFPVISNVEAAPYGENDVAELLVRQISSPVLWSNSIRYIRGQGEVEFREIGSGNVLTKLLRQIP